MSRTFHNGERRIRVKGVMRKETDLRKLARAVIEFARLQAEADAAAEDAAKRPKSSLQPPENKSPANTHQPRSKDTD
jgi:hypothetical protein